MALTVPPMFENHWNPPAGLSEIDALVYRSNLLASDRAIVNFGGGNTSVKTREADHTGRETSVLWVKGSGSDLATITLRASPACGSTRSSRSPGATR